MCGIAGLWKFDGGAIDARAFDAFVDALAHRGPDGRGIYIDPDSGLALGHRLLAIQGSGAEGKQPQQQGDRYWITFNGEVFNYVALRAQLSALGHSFCTDTDTEVVLAAYREWGEACLYKFNGMWAFAIWDSLEKKLFLSIDRFAVKSFVYLHTPGQFAFASELKSFPHLQDYTVEPDAREINRILSQMSEGTHLTFLKDVLRIPAGHSLTIEAGKPARLTRWWNTLEHLVEPPRSAREQTEQFNELFSSSVQLRMGGNAKIAIPVSGGMDSGAIIGVAGHAARHSGGKPFSSFFVKKTGTLDEEPFAMSMARHAGSTPHIIIGNGRMEVASMEQRIYACETFVPGSEGPMVLYGAVRASGAKVTLDGHGGDELLGGYPRHLPYALDDALAGLPNPLSVLQIARLHRGMAVGSENMTLTQGWKGSRRIVAEAWQRRRGAAPDAAAVAASVDDGMFPDWFDELNKELYRDVHYKFLQTLLRTFDYSSMAHGVEARTPFLDWRLVSYLFSLPSRSKIGGSFSKRILRDAMAGRMPDDVRWRRSKMGFIESNGYFFPPAVVGWMGEVFASRAFLESPLWNGPDIAAVYERWRAQMAFRTGRKLLAVAQAHFLLSKMKEENLRAKRRQGCAAAPSELAA